MLSFSIYYLKLCKAYEIKREKEKKIKSYLIHTNHRTQQQQQPKKGPICDKKYMYIEEWCFPSENAIITELLFYEFIHIQDT